MSDLGDLLELLHTAHSRAATVRAVLAMWSDQELWLTSARRWQEIAPPGTVAVTSSSAGDGRAAARFRETRYRVWRDYRGDAWRVEWEPEGAPASQVTILNGRKWWSLDLRTEAERRGSGWGPYAYRAGDYLTNVLPDGTPDAGISGSLPDRFIELMVDPASLLSSAVFEPAGGSERAARPALDAVARWRKGIDLVYIEWPYADEMRMSVDAEYGVLLRLEFRLDGAAFIRLEMEEIAFDEAFPPSLFEGPASEPGQSLP